jgi:hypothetical protein
MFNRKRCNRLSLALIVASAILGMTYPVQPAAADHAGINTWYHTQTQAAGAPIIDRASRPDLAQYAAEKWYGASNGRFVSWVEVSTVGYVVYNCAPGNNVNYIIICRDQNVPATQTGFVEKFYGGWPTYSIRAAVIHISTRYLQGGANWYPGVENLITMKLMGYAAGLLTTNTDPGSVMFGGPPSTSRAVPNAHDSSIIRAMYA